MYNPNKKFPRYFEFGNISSLYKMNKENDTILHTFPNSKGQ